MAVALNKALLVKSARRATRLFKTLANEHRMLVLCNLVDCEKTVGELEQILGIRQPTLSQQLARLRADGIVATRRNGKSIHYSIASHEARSLIGVVHDLFCSPAAKTRAAARGSRRAPRSN